MPGVLRIAHAYGSSRGALQLALAAPVDIIEADIWYRAGDIWVRHERRLGPLPMLADRGRPSGRFIIPLPNRYYLRPDINPMPLGELLEAVAGKKRLLLDVKARGGREVDAFARAIAQQVAAYQAGRWVSVCGQNWPVLHALRERAPQLEVRYSIDRSYRWERYLKLARSDEGARRICIQHRFLDGEKLAFLGRIGADIYCWTVNDRATAEALISRGIRGIISDDLALLASLPSGETARP